MEAENDGLERSFGSSPLEKGVDFRFQDKKSGQYFKDNSFWELLILFVLEFAVGERDLMFNPMFSSFREEWFPLLVLRLRWVQQEHH